MNNHNDREPGRRRLRGVRASRERLTEALARSGLKTQGALAEHMADIEGLDTAPRHLVNRAFRELPVDPLSLERIARALDVSAHRLYLAQHPTGDARPSPPVVQPSPDQRGTRIPIVGPRRWVLVLAGIAGGALSMSLAWSLWDDTPVGCDIHEWVRPPHATAGRLGLVVARFDQDDDNLGQTYLATALRNDPVLMRRISVLTSCRTFAAPMSDDRPEPTDRLDTQGRRVLRDTGAHVLLWGVLRHDRLEVRFISSPHNRDSPSRQAEDPLEKTARAGSTIRLALERPDTSLAQVKETALALMDSSGLSLKTYRRRILRNNNPPKPDAMKNPVRTSAAVHQNRD